MGKQLNRSILATALAPAAVAATVMAPAAHATMLYGNYNVLSNRWTDAAWIWAAYPCDPGNPGVAGTPINCVRISAMPSPQRGAYYGGVANLANGQYSYTTDVPDGLRCFGQVLPTRDTYTWDANTLAGVVESRFDVGCFNGPPGMNTWTFALTRM
ncbi:hypothetical protein [Mycolicibacterium fluoranthenivorans]|uniref:Secreted protein n=1 Tax=Mycolicibacterium fluoranthenivorans TaxID=258505 RepID=A0A7X5ZEA2_9MYCO|nr:hypothetical protein [Mycolicibacterium fluoranthenivorans]MCV7359575.1 hypothetical protein [Mycolicibacterium fluoranthenivorans]NIH96895.1 hypothetical protein [Mycolicibacterium fluoranthenivorans]